MANELLSSQTRQSRTALILSSSLMLIAGVYRNQITEPIHLFTLDIPLAPEFLGPSLLILITYFGISFYLGAKIDRERPRIAKTIRQARAALFVFKGQNTALLHEDERLNDDFKETFGNVDYENSHIHLTLLLSNLERQETGTEQLKNDVANIKKIFSKETGQLIKRLDQWRRKAREDINNINRFFVDQDHGLEALEKGLTPTYRLKDDVIDLFLPLTYALICILLGIYNNNHFASDCGHVWTMIFSRAL